MKTKEVKDLLQRYFDGNTTLKEERKLETYFREENVADELKQYAAFFGGISELTEVPGEATIEEDMMNFVLENERKEKSKSRSIWRVVTGIAASVVIVVGGFLFFQQQDQTYEDTFDDPQVAYAYAAQTMKYVSSKYNKGLAELSNFDKLETATEPLEKGVEPVNKALNRFNTSDGQTE